MNANDDWYHRDSSKTTIRNWWQAPEGEVAPVALAYVQEVDRLQFANFDRFVKLEAMYDTSPRTNVHNGVLTHTRSLGVMTENVIASNIDTVVAQIAATDVRAEFMTDDADWDHQRTAKQLGFYSDALAVTYGVGEKCRVAFKAAALKGTGVIKVYVDKFDQIRVDTVLVDNIVVDELECRNGQPRQMHYRDFFDAEDLKAQYPQFEKEIEAARGSTYLTTGSGARLWAGYRPFKENEVVVIESWRLPIGPKGHKNYIPGRHCITINACDLLDEEWDKPMFPFALIKWNAPVRGWYGISLAERIAGIQNALNKRNWQIERTLDKAASPITYVNIADAKLSVQTTNQIGQICVYKAAIPKTEVAPILSNETYQSRNDLKAAASEECGVSRMASQAVKPAGIDSGVAMREYRDQTTQRFAPQEKAFEQVWLDVIMLMLDCCKDLGPIAPTMTHEDGWDTRKIKWSKVDMPAVKVSIQAASTLAETPAGRKQFAMELGQMGIISQDEARELLDHPDIEGSLSIYTEALKNAKRTIERLKDGERLLPQPFQNLPLCSWYISMAYLRLTDIDSCPESVLEGFTDWLSAAANMMNPPSPPMLPTQPGMPAGPQPATTPGPGPAAPAMPPVGGPAQGAFNPGAYAPMAS